MLLGSRFLGGCFFSRSLFGSGFLSRRFFFSRSRRVLGRSLVSGGFFSRSFFGSGVFSRRFFSSRSLFRGRFGGRRRRLATDQTLVGHLLELTGDSGNHRSEATGQAHDRAGDDAGELGVELVAARQLRDRGEALDVEVRVSPM